MRNCIYVTIAILLGFGSPALSAYFDAGMCDSNSAQLSVLSFGNYLGATATLTNGKYYDFPAKKFSMGDPPANFQLPSQYTAAKWTFRFWKKMDKSQKTWSPNVINPQGYVLKDPVSPEQVCTP